MARTVLDASLEEVLSWVKQMGDRGVYHPTTARHRVSALERISSVIAGDEPQDAEYLRENLEELCNRWTRKEGANPSTARTYLSRAKVALEDFFEFRQNPSGFKPRERTQRAEKVGKREVSRPKKKETSAVPPEAGVGQGEQPMRSFPVAGSEFLYRLPTSLKVADVWRIAHHLLTFAEDFGETEMPPIATVIRGIQQVSADGAALPDHTQTAVAEQPAKGGE